MKYVLLGNLSPELTPSLVIGLHLTWAGFSAPFPNARLK